MSTLNDRTITIRGGAYFNYSNYWGEFEWFNISVPMGSDLDLDSGLRVSQRGWLVRGYIPKQNSSLR